MKQLLFVLLMISACQDYGWSQVSVSTTPGTPDPSAMLDVQSDDKGILIPRLSTEQRNLIVNPATGLLVFDTNSGSFWFYNGTAWQDISAAGTHDEIADADDNTKVMVELNPDEDTIRFQVAGNAFVKMDGKTMHVGAPGQNVFIGVNAGINDGGDADGWNTFVGYEAGTHNFFGDHNTFLGFRAGHDNVHGGANTFIGSRSGQHTTGFSNTFIGKQSGFSNTTGENGVLIGEGAGHTNVNGSDNVMIGTSSGFESQGSGNVFMGYQAGFHEMGDNKLYIANTDTDTPLVYGEFDTQLLRVHGSLNINNAYTFPLSDGASGMYLRSDGAGSLSWQMPADLVDDADADPANELQSLSSVLSLGEDAGGQDLINLDTVSAAAFVGDGSGLTGLPISPWTLNGNQVHYTNGNVGIGSLSPDMRLDISDNDVNSGIGFLPTSTGPKLIYKAHQGGTKDMQIVFEDAAGVRTEAIRIKGNANTGFVGIGTTTPVSRLEVAGTVTATAFAGDGAALVNVPGDDLGNHQAIQEFDLNTYNIINGGTVTASTFVGDGSGLINLPAWNLTGNAGLVDGVSFIGTTDTVALDFRVNNVRALRLEYAEDDGNPAPNLISGYSGNAVAANVAGATIAGGGTASSAQNVAGYFATIVGGLGNQAHGASSTIAGGSGNTTSGVQSTVAGGLNNVASGSRSTVSGGSFNAAVGIESTVLGGQSNTASGLGATVLGGYENSAAGNHSVATGYGAQINASHHGTFLFADDQLGTPFTSAAANEFAVRATGGVRFITSVDSTGNPTQSVSINNTGTINANAFVGDGSGLTNIPGDDLGDHLATQDINLNNYRLTNGTSGTGLNINTSGTATLRTNNSSTIGLILDGSNTPALRFNQDGTQGWTPQVWDIAGNESSFFIRDISHGSKLPFKVKPGSDHDRIVIDGQYVGIGVEDPTEVLDVNGQVRMRTGAQDGYVPISDSDGVMVWTDPDVAGFGDDLGSHVLSDTLQLNDQWIMNGSGGYGISLNANGTARLLTNNNTPGVQLESGDTPRLRFYQNDSGPYDPYTWDITAHEISWQVNDVTNGTFPFLIHTGNPTNSLVIKGGKIGIGNNNPGDLLHLSSGGIRMTNSEVNQTSDVAGVLMFDENFYAAGDIGNGHFAGNGGGLGIKNEDGWGALISTANMSWLNMDVNSLHIGGSTDPGDNNLIVEGVVRIAGGSPGSGKVLTSDNTGNATWQDVPGSNINVQLSTNTYNSGNDDDEWRDVSAGVTHSYTSNGYLIEANQSLRLTEGTGIDAFEIRVQVTASCTGDITYTNVISFTPPEGLSDHDNFVIVPYLAFLDSSDVPCGPTTLTFTLQVRNTGDDIWESRDRTLVVTKY